MFTRVGCHLCEEAWRTLTEAQRHHGFALSTVDVDTDPALQKLYGEVVPAVTINGKLRFRGGVNYVLLERLLRQEAEKARSSTHN